jgi:hypothetical protein
VTAEKTYLGPDIAVDKAEPHTANPGISMDVVPRSRRRAGGGGRIWSSYIPVNHRIDHPGPPANLREVVETFDFNPNGWHNSVWPKQK